MSVQSSLFDPDVRKAGLSRLRFEKFHHENPHVYRKLLELAFGLKSRGRNHYGISGLFEVLRWGYAMSTTDKEFKLNNNHKPFYARLIMEREPSLKGFFDLREQTNG